MSERLPKRIVAEVTRNWVGNENDTLKATLLSQRFEKVIAMNAERGFMLEDWRVAATQENGHICETIIAVFVEVL